MTAPLAAGTRALYLTKHGLAENPTGLHVIYEYLGRTLLGEVVSAEYREHGCAGVYLTVKHMDGTPWPVQPGARCVRALVRTWPRPCEGCSKPATVEVAAGQCVMGWCAECHASMLADYANGLCLGCGSVRAHCANGCEPIGPSDFHPINAERA